MRPESGVSGGTIVAFLPDMRELRMSEIKWPLYGAIKGPTRFVGRENAAGGDPRSHASKPCHASLIDIAEPVQHRQQI
jgi:hypothetical protein